ncbi:Hypothetical protein, putative [Bodo saltans]|uniref:Uncharacterized protein n=1 Tax=Bodo saltans TaxID=75058 RepID=A0A0S4JS56_BODSA|nr:Hypothetical protein, putative [Bodo saltans]|eukprot:CUG91358.1 Hypothetical protein, putative [Bodo saltans]
MQFHELCLSLLKANRTMPSEEKQSALVDSPPDTMLVLPEAAEQEHLPRLIAGLRRSTRTAEGDVQFLQRRVQKLKAEEEHVWKKLESARELREKSESARQRRQEEAEARASQKQRLLDEQARERARLHDERDAHRHSLFLARSKLAMQKRERSSRLRTESRELSQERIAKHNAHDKNAAHHHQLIVDMHVRALQSRNEQHQSQQREAVVLREKQHQQVSLAASLLTEEAQIIHRLQQIKRETTSVLSGTVSSAGLTPSPRKPPRPPAASPIAPSPHSARRDVS